LGNPDWYFTRATGSGYLIDGHQYLAHTGVEIDEQIWLSQEDVAKGEDTVVKAALQWIQNSVFAHDIQLDRVYAKPGIDSVGITANVENPDNHNVLVQGLILNNSEEIIDSTLFFDDGNHNDGAGGDGLCGAFWPTMQEEQHYYFKTRLIDLDSGTTRSDYNITRFTTIGPVVLDHYVNLSADTLINPGDVMPIKLVLRNEGKAATASNIYIDGGVLDTVVTDVSTSNNSFADIPPGSAVTSNGVFVIRFANNFEGGREITFWVDIYSDGYSFWSDTFSVYIYPTHISSKENGNLPEQFYLGQNYPNPFNSQTTIDYQLPEPGHVIITIYNAIGQKIIKLLDENKETGNHNVIWNGCDSNEKSVTSGIYFYKIEMSRKVTNQLVAVKKMLFLQ
jgi:hypothetical protein